MDLELRPQYQTVVHGDAKLFLFPSKGDKKRYRIVIDEFDPTWKPFFREVALQMQRDSRSLMRLCYDNVRTQTANMERYGLAGYDENDLWVRLDSALMNIYNASGRLGVNYALHIRIDIEMLGVLVCLLMALNTVLVMAPNTLYVPLATAYDLIKKERP